MRKAITVNRSSYHLSDYKLHLGDLSKVHQNQLMVQVFAVSFFELIRYLV